MSRREVHLTHCCAIHGCKYGDDDCPVALGEHIGMTFKDEQCDYVQEENAELIEDLMNAQADLQTALGLYRLINRDYEPKAHDAIEDHMQKSLARLHTTLAYKLSHPMWGGRLYPGINHPCPRCGGDPIVDDPYGNPETCDVCGGSGYAITKEERDAPRQT
jgi:hypothetical protein